MENENKKIIWQAHEANLSGANIAMLEYVNALTIRFNFFIILPHHGNMQQELQRRAIPYSIINQLGWTNDIPWWNIIKVIKIFVRSIIALKQTRKLVKQEKPAFVFTNTLVPFVASIASWLQRVPHVWWIHEYGKEDFGFKTGWGNEKLSIWWMQKSSSLIIANSKAISTKYGMLMPTANIKTIYQPVTFNSIEAVIDKQAKFLMFGQLIPSKGHIDVLKAMVDNKLRAKPLNSLHIKGPCEMKTYLDELNYFVHKHNLQYYVKIEVGNFKKEEVMPQYDILIVASKSEAFGRVIVEANKAGLRVLVRNNGGAPELINDSNGLLFSTITELSEVLSGERIFPDKPIRINYDETTEILKLNELLNIVCI